VLGALWGYVGDACSVVYLCTSTGKRLGQRPGEIGPEEFLAMRRGYVVADASNLFDTSFQSEARIEVGCNMQARRYFVKASTRTTRALPCRSPPSRRCTTSSRR
jgi:hypothetical protein